MTKFLPTSFALLLLLFLVDSSTKSFSPQYQYRRNFNQSLADQTWNLFQNRNRRKVASDRLDDDALLLNTQTSVPSNALHSPRKMFILLGARFYNPDLQSISIPQAVYQNPHGELTFPSKKSPRKGIRKRIRALKRYFNGVFIQDVVPALGVYGSCPVLSTWTDYGDSYWPRWVKEGRCVDLEGTSCSLPPGMFCVGHEERSVVMLRYFCPLSGDENSCNWYRMQKPVLISCKCACP